MARLASIFGGTSAYDGHEKKMIATNLDNLAKSQNTEHAPPRFQQLTRCAGVGSAFFAIPTIFSKIRISRKIGYPSFSLRESIPIPTPTPRKPLSHSVGGENGKPWCPMRKLKEEEQQSGSGSVSGVELRMSGRRKKSPRTR